MIRRILSRFVFTFSRRGFAKREGCVYARGLMKRRFGAPRGSTQARTSAQTNEILTMTIQFLACIHCSKIVRNFEEGKIRTSILDSPFPPEILKSSSLDASDVRILRVSLNQLLDIQRFLEFSKIFDAPATIVSASLNRGNRFARHDLFQHLLAWILVIERLANVLEDLGSVTEFRRTS